MLSLATYAVNLDHAQYLSIRLPVSTNLLHSSVLIGAVPRL
jgi:hypothetical protein